MNMCLVAFCASVPVTPSIRGTTSWTEASRLLSVQFEDVIQIRQSWRRWPPRWRCLWSCSLPTAWSSSTFLIISCTWPWVRRGWLASRTVWQWWISCQGRLDSGEQSLALHVLQECANVLPLLCLLEGLKVIFLALLPRYLQENCCNANNNVPNRYDESF